MNQPTPSKKRAVVIWPKFGPYHLARITALQNHPTIEIIPVETLSNSRYGDIFSINEHNIGLVSLGLDQNTSKVALREGLDAVLDRSFPDVVFVPGWSLPTALIAIDLCVSKDIPFVVMSASTRIDNPSSAAKDFIKQRIVGLASSALVGGGPQADYLTDLHFPRERISFGYNTVDNDYFAAGAAATRGHESYLRAEYNLPERFFLCCVRLVPKKNLQSLIDAYALYRASVGAKAWDLVIVGPGPLEQRLSDEITERGLQQAVYLLGARPYAALPTLYALAETLILASTTEQWGLVVNEAMATGLPVLVSKRCGCHVDLVDDGRNGFIFDPYDVGEMSDAMVRISSHGVDLEGMGRASQEIIAHWGPNRFAEGFEEAFNTALGSPAPRISIFDRVLLRMLNLR